MNINLYDLLIEEELKQSERNKLKDDEFGIPSKRGFPLHDKNHVQMAIKLFSKADEEDKHQLANNIFNKAKEYDININKDSQLFSYLTDENKKSILNENITLNEDSIIYNESNDYQIYSLTKDLINKYSEQNDELKKLKFINFDLYSGYILISNSTNEVLAFIYGSKVDNTIIDVYEVYNYLNLGYSGLLIEKMVYDNYDKVIIEKDKKDLISIYLNHNFIISNSTNNFLYLVYDLPKNINNDKLLNDYLLDTAYEEISNYKFNEEINLILEDHLTSNEINLLLESGELEVLENIKGIDRFRNKDKYGVKYMDFAPNEKDDLVKKEYALKLINDDTFVTSDLHLNYKERSSANFIIEMINEINNRVPKEGTLLILGDIGDKRNPNQKSYIKNFVNRLNVSKKILILGNHDILSLDDYYNMGFLYVGIRLENSKYIFTHTPVPAKRKINIHGHIHGSREYWNMDWKNHIDVYCKDHNNHVLKISEYIKLFKAGKYDGNTVYKDFTKDNK